MDNRLLCLGITCLILSLIYGANSNVAFSQVAFSHTCPYGYYMTQNHLCYLIQSQPTNGTQSPLTQSPPTNGSQLPPPQNQLQTLSCPYGYYLATNYLCYPLQSRPTNATRPPSLSSTVTNFGSPTQIINEVKPGLPILPLTISDSNHALVGNIIFFINSTDGHYHLKGVKRNVLPETVDIPSVGISFYDQVSGRLIDSATDSSPAPRLEPGALEHFDIDTGYNVTRAAKEFKYMYAEISGP